MKDQDVIFQPRKIQRRILLAAVLIVPNIVVWAGLYSAEGIIIQRDFNFPIFNENFENSYFPLWNEDTSQTNIERFPRLVMMAPFLGLSALGVEVSTITKLMIVGAFAFMTVAGFLFLNAIQKFVGSRNGGKFLQTSIIPLVGAYIFAYSPVSIQFAWEISFLVSIATLPVMLYLVLTRITQKYFPILMAASLLLCLAHPFLFIMNAIIVLLFTITIHFRSFKTKLILSRLAFTGAIGLVLLAWLWVPFSSAPTNSTELGRDEHLERDVFENVSNNEVHRILLLERDRFVYVATTPGDFFGRAIHLFAVASLVAVAFMGLIMVRNGASRRLMIFLTAGFVITTLFALGSSGALDELYWTIIAESSIGWIVRSPLKFQLYQGFFISAVFAISLMLLSTRIRHVRIVPVIALGVLVGSSVYGIHDANVNSLNPIPLPVEYYEISDMVGAESNAKVLYLPRYNELPTHWSQGHMIAPYDMKSSQLGTYDTYLGYNFVKETLYDYPYTNNELKSSNFYDYLRTLGIRYIVFHDDRGYDIDQRNLQYLQQSASLTTLYDKNGWYLFEVQGRHSEQMHAITRLAEVQNLDEVFDVATISTPAIKLSINNELSHVRNVIEVLRLSNIDTDVPITNELVTLISDADSTAIHKSWTPSADDFTLSIVTDSTAGNFVSISTSVNSSNKWSNLISNELEVIQSQKYLFTAVAKTQNAYASHVKIQGFNGSSGAWADLAFITKGNETSTGLSINANTDWTRYWNTLTIPADVDKIRYVINAGTVKDPTRGEAVTLLRETGVYNLDGNAASNVQVDYTKISATEYSVDVSSEVPFILVFTESFDKGWVATDGGQEIGSIPLYGMINGFYIDKTGDFTLTLEYKPQRMFALGATISIAAVIGILFYTLKLFSDLVIREYDRTGARTYSAGSLRRAVGIAILTERDQTMTNALGQSNTALDNTRPAEPNLPQPEAGKRLKRRTGNATSPYETSLRKYVMHLPVLVSVGLVLCIPFLVLFEIPHTNLVAGFALDFMVVSVIWMFFLPKLTRKKITLNTPSR